MTLTELIQEIARLQGRKLNRHERRKLHVLKVKEQKLRQEFALRQLERRA